MALGFASLALSLLALFIASRVVKYVAALKKVSHMPGLRSVFTPMTPFGAFLPTSRLNPGMNWMWRWRNTVYPRYGVETISIVPYVFGQPTICTTSPDVARQILSPKGDYIKGEEISAPVTEYGPNLFSVEGDEWKRHRRILNPAFSPATYALVWHETCRIYDEMVATEGWSNQKHVLIPRVDEMTKKLALVVISRCGFGNGLPWDFTKDAVDGMSFAQALGIVSDSHIIRLVVPRWAYKLPIKSIQDMDKAFVSLGRFMTSLINSKRASLHTNDVKPESSRDIFSLMLKASEGEGNLAMNDGELAGNTFLMLFAGHDTAAHMLDATIGLLGLYQDIQEDVYRQVMEVAPDEKDLTFQNSPRLFKVRGAFLEAGRLFPPVQMMLRDVVKDSVLTGVGPDGNEQIPTQPGLRLVVDVVGMNYNPRLYPDPEAFKPERWYDANENDMLMFSTGPRSCIGRRFALTEATCFLARLLRDWKIDIVLENGETREQWRTRVMRAIAFMTLRVEQYPIRLTRRS